MGMSASQARFLCLTARKNNVEFEGQQINQQRTTLSNESASYYSELCNMSVPVPPSIDDYTKVSYTFNDGAMTNTVTSLLYSKNDNSYHVNYVQQWQDDYAIVPSSTSLVQVSDSSYIIGGTTLRKIDGTTIPTAGTDEYFDSLDSSQKTKALETEKYYLDLLRDYINDSSADFYVRYVKNNTTGNYEPCFYLGSELVGSPATDRNLKSVPAYKLGSETKSKEILNQKCAVEQDTSGRYVSITVELDNGEHKKYTLNATTTTDEDAYNDAMNDYNYKQHAYDHKIQEINSKLEIIQQQDKQLELKLKQLDTEENAISTEMDAVKKVISKNVDNSFKTFSA